MVEQNNQNNQDSVKTEERKLHIRTCSRCKQPYQTKIGIDNWKNLFRAPTLEEWITLIIMLLLIVSAFAYTTETKACKETLNNLDEICLKRGNIINYTKNEDLSSNIFILNESTSGVNSSNDSSSNLNNKNENTTYVNYSSSNLTNHQTYNQSQD